jgi:hypothetical protein
MLRDPEGFVQSHCPQFILDSVPMSHCSITTSAGRDRVILRLGKISENYQSGGIIINVSKKIGFEIDSHKMGCEKVAKTWGEDFGDLENMTVAVGFNNPEHSDKTDAWFLIKWMWLFVIGLVAFNAANLFAYTPDSPQVKNLIKKGDAFLCSELSNDVRPGAQAVAGIALLKSGVQPDHPKILKAVEMVKSLMPGNDPTKAQFPEIYTAGLSLIFLVTLDPLKYKPEIDCLMQYLYAKQKKHGGWGYFDRDTGDTSMTQYGVLSSWEAKQAGYNVPLEVMDGVATWLLRTQDPSGGFGYQGKIGPDGTLIPQEEVRESMSAAGGGCIYILTDFFQLETGSKKKDDLPAALKNVRTRENMGATQLRINARQLRDSQLLTAKWFEKNYTIEPKHDYKFYYLYALERYMSFRDLIEQTSDKEPKWYNEGVDFIIKHQSPEGSWDDQCGPTAGTAFAVLFLVRSTKKSIEKAKNFGAGVLIGGRGLPSENERLEIQNGQPVVKQSVGPADDLLKILDDSNEADYEKALEMMSELPSQQVESLLSAHGEKLRKLTREQDSEARMAAVVALGKTRSLDNVPALIYALTDPDREVVIEARKSLERISRNPVGLGPQDNYNEEQRQNAIKKWKSWYLSLRPDADVDF